MTRLAALLAAAFRLAIRGLPVRVQKLPEAVRRLAERLGNLPDVQVRCDALAGMSEGPLHDDQLFAFVDHQRALRVPKVVHPYGWLTLGFDPKHLQGAMPD